VSGFTDVDYFKVRTAIDRVERRARTDEGAAGTAVAA
jgi:hypothetical protein